MREAVDWMWGLQRSSSPSRLALLLALLSPRSALAECLKPRVACNNRPLYTCSLETCTASELRSDGQISLDFSANGTACCGVYGTIPSALGSLGSLLTGKVVFDGANQLTGTLPPSLSSLLSLGTLRIVDNAVTGTIPPQIGSLQNLEYLHFSKMGLTGTVPASLGSLVATTSLYIRSTLVSGQMPQSLCSLPDTSDCHMANNVFSCPLATCPNGDDICSTATCGTWGEWSDCDACDGTRTRTFMKESASVGISAQNTVDTSECPCATTSQPDAGTTDVGITTVAAQSSQHRVGLISGLSAGFGVLFIVGILALIWWLMRQKAKSAKPGNGNGNGNDNGNGNGDRPTHQQEVAGVPKQLHKQNRSHRKLFEKYGRPERKSRDNGHNKSWTSLTAVQVSTSCRSPIERRRSDAVIQAMQSYLSGDVEALLRGLPSGCIDVEEANVIGTGGAGRIYATTLLDTLISPDRTMTIEAGTAVALKETFAMVAATGKPDSSAAEVVEFANELKLLHSMNHPHIVPFLGLYRDAGVGLTMNGRPRRNRYFLVTKFAENGSLDQYFHRPFDEEPFGFSLRRRWVLEIASAVSYLHRKRIVHRDLKPDNILLDDKWSCMLTDFGVSRSVDNNKTLTKQIGTVFYMPPEALQRDGSSPLVSPKASSSPIDTPTRLLRGKDLKTQFAEAFDMYSLGILSAAIFNAKRPYQGRPSALVGFHVLVHGLRPELPGCLSPAAHAILQKMWHLDPTKRPRADDVVKLFGVVLVEVDFQQQGGKPDVPSLNSSEAGSESDASVDVSNLTLVTLSSSNTTSPPTPAPNSEQAQHSQRHVSHFDRASDDDDRPPPTSRPRSANRRTPLATFVPPRMTI